MRGGGAASEYWTGPPPPGWAAAQMARRGRSRGASARGRMLGGRAGGGRRRGRASAGRSAAAVGAGRGAEDSGRTRRGGVDAGCGRAAHAAALVRARGRRLPRGRVRPHQQGGRHGNHQHSAEVLPPPAAVGSSTRRRCRSCARRPLAVLPRVGGAAAVGGRRVRVEAGVHVRAGAQPVGAAGVDVPLSAAVGVVRGAVRPPPRPLRQAAAAAGGAVAPRLWRRARALPAVAPRHGGGVPARPQGAAPLRRAVPR